MTEKKRTSINTMTSEELCKILGLKTDRSLDAKNFPKPFFENDEMLFDRDAVMEFFNVDNFDEPFINTKEAAKILDILPNKLVFLASRHRLPSYKLKFAKGSGYLFRKSELEKFAEFDLTGDAEFVNLFTGIKILKKVAKAFIDKMEFKNETTRLIVYGALIDGKSLTQISEEVELTKERVRQIVNKEVNRALKNYYLSPPDVLTIRKEIKQAYNSAAYWRNLYERAQGADAIYKNFSKADIYNITVLMRTPLADCEELSVRALNSLNTAGLKTIGGLISFCRNNKTKELLKIKNLGQKSYTELTDLIVEVYKKVREENGLDLNIIMEKEGLLFS